MKASFANVARQILNAQPSAKDLGGFNCASNPDLAVEAVKAWLCLPKNTRWLMLFDNLDNPKIPGNTDTAAVDFLAFLPSAQQGFVAVTTRSSGELLESSIRTEWRSVFGTGRKDEMGKDEA